MKQQLNEGSEDGKFKVDSCILKWECLIASGTMWSSQCQGDGNTREQKDLHFKEGKKNQQLNLSKASDPDRKICTDEKKETKHRWLDQFSPQITSGCTLSLASPRMSLKISPTEALLDSRTWRSSHCFIFYCRINKEGLWSKIILYSVPWDLTYSM